jgi:hypothetical protein
MACYFGQLKGIFREATVRVTAENESDIARFLAELVRVPDGDCPGVWKVLRPWVEDRRMRQILVIALRDEFGEQ